MNLIEDDAMATATRLRPQKKPVENQDVDLFVNKNSEDYKLLVHAAQSGKPVSLKGKSKEEIMKIFGKK